MGFMKNRTDSQRRNALALVLLASLALVAYANSFQAGFPFDNRFLILQDPRLRAASAENIGLIFSQNYWGRIWQGGIYRPLTTLSYLFNYAILGNSFHPFGYHVVNYLLHAMNAYLVYLVALVLLSNFRQALFMAALWALHPVCTESVTNIIGRADELAALSVLGSLLLYIRSTASKGRRKVAYLLGMMLLTAAGVFSKESAVTIAGLVVLYDFTYRYRSSSPGQDHLIRDLAANAWRFFREGSAALIPPLLVMWYVRYAVFAKSNAAIFPFLENPLVGAGFATARMTAVKVLGKYLWLLVWPLKLSSDYSYNQIPLVDSRLATWEDWKALVALAAVVGILFVAGACYRHHKTVFFLIGFSVLTILPTANLFILIGTIMAERFLYLPAMGFAGCLVLAVYAVCGRWAMRPWAAPAALCVIGAAFGVRTILRNPDWKDDETLWSKAIEVCPNSYKSHYNLAHSWFEKDPRQIDRSISQAEQALAIVASVPDELASTLVYQELGAYYGHKGDMLARKGPNGTVTLTPESAVWYRKAVQISLRGVAIDREFNAVCRSRELARGKSPDTIGLFGAPDLYGNLGQAYIRLGASQEASEAFAYRHQLTSGKNQ